MQLTDLMRLLYQIDAAQTATREEVLAGIGISAPSHITPLEHATQELRLVAQLCDFFPQRVSP
ncbi:hypothetical protein [Leptolyngbya sp. FACHB-261]|uniref:hypothetical protein n=1 Tax=Leptolyngbya sp. FACHB-261 TaxID=2692806 RepID=UPI0016872C39|nr:hypothetical protein [Leptolyngbya sp. FACHB-261]MBD2105209.1 hypothetical protein [Leptolyngbya sp. FACHB-261]